MTASLHIWLAAVVGAVATTGAGPAAAAEDPVEDTMAAALSEGGAELSADVDWSTRPEYSLWAGIEPSAGDVAVLMRARLPVGTEPDEIRLRWFPGVATEGATITSAAVDGVVVSPRAEASMITLPLAAPHGVNVTLDLAFRFTAPSLASQPVDPASDAGALLLEGAGLLARSADMMTLGHWFPVWVPEGFSADAELDGYGDIANYPAATISARLDVPEGSTVVTSGVRLAEQPGGVGRIVYTEGAIGLRDLAVVVIPAAEQVETTAGDVNVRVTAPAGTSDLAPVGELAARSVTTLSAALGSYPWDELDIVSVPLGAGVAGMEWPGMVWIESTVFAGGIPGLGDLGPDAEQITELLSDAGRLEDLGLGDFALMIDTMREWTIAHEVGHMWWHALVGNDSITAPVVDEPLAQHSACLVERELRPADAETICDVNTSGQFEQMQMLMGVADAAADQPTDEFDSAVQYGAVVYGKAPMFYRALEERYGVEAATAALASLVREHAFGQVTPDDVRTTLGVALGDAAGVDALWQYWIEETHGATSPSTQPRSPRKRSVPV